MRKITDLYRIVDIFLTGYSEYILGLEFSEHKDVSKYHLHRSLHWFKLLCKYTDEKTCIPAVNAVDRLLKAVEEDPKLEEDFVLEVERDIQNTLVEIIRNWCRE